MFGKKKEDEPAPAVEVKVEEKPKTGSGLEPSPVTSIGKGITMVGNFETQDTLEIYGTHKGLIKSNSKVNVKPTGTLLGDAIVNNLVTEGYVNGTIKCLNSASFSSTGRMEGTLTTKVLQTAPGSNFKGTLNLINGAAPQEAAPAAAQDSTKSQKENG